MKKFLALIVGFALLALLAMVAWNIRNKVSGSAATSKSMTMQERKTLDVEEGSYLYEVIDGEATIKGELIDRVLVGKNVNVTYRNKILEDIRPTYIIKFYNRYGVMIGKKKVGSFSLSDLMIGPSEVASESLSFEKYNITEILKHSDVRIKEDFENIKWVVISDSNSSLDPVAE